MRLLLVLVAACLSFAPASGAERHDMQDLIVQCAACHGADGIARDVETPDIAGQHDIYLYNQMKAFRDRRRPHKEMRYMGRQMTDEEMRALADYYASQPKQ